MRISEYSIRNFKSFEKGSFEVSDHAILIGKNNSGKSNLIKSLEILRENILRDANRHFEREDGNWFSKSVIGKDTSKTISWEVIFELTDEERLRIIDNLTLSNSPHNSSVEDAIEENWFRNIKIEVKSSRTGSASLDYYLFYNNEATNLSDISKSKNSFRYKGYNTTLRMSSATLSEMIADSMRSWKFVSPIREPDDLAKAEIEDKLDRRGENLVQVLNYLSSNRPSVFRKIRRSYLEIMEGVSDMSAQFDEDSNTSSDVTIMVEEDAFDSMFKASDISSGSKEILVLLAQIYLSGDRTDMLAIEEPELHLHPGASKKVFDVLQTQSEKNDVQLIISTHSSVFVNQTPVESLVRVEREGTSIVRSVSEGEIDRELKDLGYDQSDLLQSEGVVLVEGRSDRLILGKICEKFGVSLSELGIEIVELEGEGNVKAHSVSLVKIFISFDIPYLYIVDSHGNDPYDEMEEYLERINRNDVWWHTSPDHFFVWTKYSIESYLLNPEAIASVLGIDPAKVEKLIEEAGSDSEIEEQKPENVLEYIFKQESNDYKRGESAYDKVGHGPLIAKATNIRSFPEEVKDVVKNIRDLPDRPPSSDISE